jgi:hypothetical protein
MTFTSLEEINSIIENPINAEMLKRACEIREKHELHVSGIGLDDYIDKIQGVENDRAVSLRRALGKVITYPESQKITSVQNKVFSARGGGRFYEFSNENDQARFKDFVLKNVKNDMPMSVYMRKIWKELVNTDPNGLIMAEITSDGMDVFFSYKSSDSIHDIAYKGAQNIEYVIFKPEKGKDGVKYYRVVDDSYDYLIAKNDKKIWIVEEQTYPNPWGFVPATFTSDKLDSQSNGFNTHINEAMIYADDMLLDYTIYKIYKTRIGIPAQWQYERSCATCDGSGQVLDKTDNHQNIKCGSCGGSGYDNHNRDVADIFILPLPETDDVPLSPPLGYVVPDLESWAKYEETIKHEADKMYSSVWGEGVTIESDRRNVTAQELVVRDSTKQNKLDEFSDNEENVEKRLTDILGLFYFPGTYQGAIVNNGRDYSLKSVDQLEKEYSEGLEKGLSSTELTKILTNLYHTQYSRSPQRLNAAIVKLNTKPFYHWKPDYLSNLSIEQIDYYKNLYYDEFTTWYELNKESFGITTIEKINNELDKWIVQKLPEQSSINQSVESDE